MDTTETPQKTTPAAPKGKWRTKITACRKKREKLNKTWQVNVDYRKNKVYSTTDDTQDRIAVPVDWARTKNKIAQLFFQVPAIKAKARRPEFVGAAALYACGGDLRAGARNSRASPDGRVPVRRGERRGHGHRADRV
jgi:hypothetical protein